MKYPEIPNACWVRFQLLTLRPFQAFPSKEAMGGAKKEVPSANKSGSYSEDFSGVNRVPRTKQRSAFAQGSRSSTRRFFGFNS